MNFYIALGLIAGFFLVYLVIIEIFTVLFRLTGLTSERSSFQVISLLTNSGFTTGESELIVSTKGRRKIAKASMILGYAFSVIIVSLIVNLVLSIGNTNTSDAILFIVIFVVALILLILIFKIKFIRKPFDNMIEFFANKIINGKNKNSITLIDTYGSLVMVEIKLNLVPEVLEGKRLFETNLRQTYNINVLLVQCGKGNMNPPSRDTLLKKNDTIMVFGPQRTIREVFYMPNSLGSRVR